MQEDIFERKRTTAKGIYGIFPANQVNDDDIELTDENGKHYKHFDATSAITKKRRQILPCRIFAQDSGKQIIWVLLCNYTGLV
jgi:5-methyltetrahydrofolate--homocysteine methyltransferase